MMQSRALDIDAVAFPVAEHFLHPHPQAISPQSHLRVGEIDSAAILPDTLRWLWRDYPR